MTLQYMESFDYIVRAGLNNSQQPPKWDGSASAWTFYIDDTSWGGGLHCMNMLGNSSFSGYGSTYYLPPNPSYSTAPFTLTCGFRIRLVSTPAAVAQVMGWTTYNQGSNDYGPSISITPGGAVQVYGYGSGLLASSSAGVIIQGNTYFMEFAVTRTSTTAPTIGDVAVRVNGSTVCGATGVVLNSTTFTVQWRQMEFMARTGSPFNFLVRDIYCTDSTGTLNTGYLGDTPMGILLPAQDGAYHDFNPPGIHYPLVNDRNPDYAGIITAFGVNKRDSYVCAPPANTGGSIAGVSILVACRTCNNTTDPRTIAPFFRIGGTDYVGTDRTIYGGSQCFSLTWGWGTGGSPFFFHQRFQIFELNPATGSAWTYSDLAALEVGVKTTNDGGTGGEMDVTQVVVEVTLPGSSTPTVPRHRGWAEVIGAGDTGVQGLSPAGLLDSGKSVRSALSGLGGVPATVKEDT